MADNERDGGRSGNGGGGGLNLPASVRIVPVECSNGAIFATHHWAEPAAQHQVGELVSRE